MDGGRLGYPRNDLTGIERKNGRVRVDGVGVQDFREVHGFEHGFREVRSERVFVRTVGDDTDGKMSAQPRCTRRLQGRLTWNISVLLLVRGFVTQRRRLNGRVDDGEQGGES